MKDLKIKVNGTEISIESSPVMSKEANQYDQPLTAEQIKRKKNDT